MEEVEKLIEKEGRMAQAMVKKYGDKDIHDLGKEECEHELNIVDEEWMSEGVMATAECQKCNAKFRGMLIKQ